MTRPADLRLDVYIVRHGYQADLYAGGEKIGTECRDFGDDHDEAKLLAELLAKLRAALVTWREGK